MDAPVTVSKGGIGYFGYFVKKVLDRIVEIWYNIGASEECAQNIRQNHNCAKNL